MSGQIRVTPQQLRDTAGRCDGFGNDCEQLIQRTQQLIDSLRDTWEGRASEQYAQQFAELRPSFDRMRRLYTELSGQLRSTARILEETDQQISAQFGVR